MDVKSFLIQQGASEEDAATIAGNPTLAGAWTKLASEAEEGKTAYLKAQETKTALEQWNQTQVIPYVQKADAALAEERARNAQMSAHMKSLKDSGYDIPDAYLTAPAAGAPTTMINPTQPASNANSNSKELYDFARVNMELISLSNRYRKLTGDELDPVQEYTEFESNKRPNENLRSYIDRKYELTGKESAKQAEAKQSYEDNIRKEASAKAIAEYQAKHGANGETRTPVNSRFDRVADERKTSGGDKLWQTQAGRDQATKNRLEKYSGLVN